MDAIYKKDINETIKETNDIIKRLKKTLTQKKEGLDEIMMFIKYQENQSRFQQTTLMFVVASEQKKPKSSLESIIKKKMEYMSNSIELLSALVEHGVIPEKMYLDKCDNAKEIYQYLQEYLENY
jgi:hypothetical protein